MQVFAFEFQAIGTEVRHAWFAGVSSVFVVIPLSTVPVASFLISSVAWPFFACFACFAGNGFRQVNCIIP